MKERILRIKLGEIQRFIMFNHSNKNDMELKAKLKSMIEDKPKEKGITILGYIRNHIGDDILTTDNGGNRFGIYERGSFFYMILQDTIDDILDDIGCSDSEAPELEGGPSVDSKEENKQPQQLEQQQNTKKRGRSAKPFSDCIAVKNKEGLLNMLHQVLDERKGKYVYLVINTLVYEGKIFKPTFAQLRNEFGDIGNDSLKSVFGNINSFEKGEIEGVKKMFAAF